MLPLQGLILILFWGITCSRMSWKFLKDFTIHWFKQNKKRKGGTTNNANAGCIAWELECQCEKHLDNPWSSSSHWSVFCLFIISCPQMCRRWADLFSDLWGGGITAGVLGTHISAACGRVGGRCPETLTCAICFTNTMTSIWLKEGLMWRRHSRVCFRTCEFL